MRRVASAGPTAAWLTTRGPGSFDGCTYLVDVDMHVARFDFGRDVYAFTAGPLATAPGRTEPCLVYVPFGGGVHIFHGLDLAAVPGRPLVVDGLDAAAVARALYGGPPPAPRP